MSVGTKSIVTKVDGCTAGSVTNLNAARFAAINNTLNSCIVDKFASCAALPAACNNTGRLVYIESICSYRYSDGVSWSTDFDSTAVTLRELYTWGCNSVGQLGNNTTTSTSSPGTMAGGGTTWCQIHGGNAVFAAVKTDGTLWNWGCGSSSRLGNCNSANQSSPVTTIGGGTTWCMASHNGTVGAGVKTDGTLWAWGYNLQGEVGDGTSGFLNIRGSPVTTAGGGTTWCSVHMHVNPSTAIKTDGTLWTWGSNFYGNLGDGTTNGRSSPGTTIGAGTNWCQSNGPTAIKTDGTLWTWGQNFRGELGDGTTTSRSSPGTTSGGGTNWCMVAGAGNSRAAIKTDGTLWTWGWNCWGGLGNGTANDFVGRSSPGTTAGGGTNWSTVAIGIGNFEHKLSVKTDGTLWTWGRNYCGNLGDGTIINRSSPGTVIGGISTWSRVTGALSSAAITNSTVGFNAAA